ncbi:hypothetical protein F4679DRAFT_9044 [Xylaria curta]|nr:hypothetical protein F4679DRAFT_9044 [Xylaria curta]
MRLNCRAARSAELQDQLMRTRGAPQDLSIRCLANRKHDESLSYVVRGCSHRSSVLRGWTSSNEANRHGFQRAKRKAPNSFSCLP